MNPELIKLLFNPTLYIEESPKYFEDDFDVNKRKNRLFTNKQKDQCWNRGRIIPGRDPDRWRYDAVGNIVLKALRGCQGPLCHEYDHRETTVRNCQILQTSTNKFKSNKTGLETGLLKSASREIKMTESEMDIIEKAIYANVKKFI
jgi:hypothetical protein